MAETLLHELLARNARHVESLPAGHFDDVEKGQRPAVVSVCCSDSRVAQEGMWAVEKPGWLFAPSSIGNVTWDRHEGERVVDGSVLYPIAFTDTRVAVVVGHTGCGAIDAALSAVREGSIDAPAGVRRRIQQIVPVVEAGLADDRVDADSEDAVDRLVEYNVDEQTTFLRASEAVPDDLTVYGFVYDFQGVYGDRRGRAYLVNAGGETDPETLRDLVPDAFESHVERLL